MNRELKLIYIPLDDYRLSLLLEASEALNLTVEELIQQGVTEFLAERKR